MNNEMTKEELQAYATELEKESSKLEKQLSAETASARNAKMRLWTIMESSERVIEYMDSLEVADGDFDLTEIVSELKELVEQTHDDPKLSKYNAAEYEQVKQELKRDGVKFVDLDGLDN